LNQPAIWPLLPSLSTINHLLQAPPQPQIFQQLHQHLPHHPLPHHLLPSLHHHPPRPPLLQLLVAS
jgi:hypothetical protein